MSVNPYQILVPSSSSTSVAASEVPSIMLTLSCLLVKWKHHTCFCYLCQRTLLGSRKRTRQASQLEKRAHFSEVTCPF